MYYVLYVVCTISESSSPLAWDIQLLIATPQVSQHPCKHNRNPLTVNSCRIDPCPSLASLISSRGFVVKLDSDVDAGRDVTCPTDYRLQTTDCIRTTQREDTARPGKKIRAETRAKHAYDLWTEQREREFHARQAFTQGKMVPVKTSE